VTSPPPDPNQFAATLERLMEPGFLGFYTCFEVTELFALEDISRRVVNVLTVAVAEDRGAELLGSPSYLTPRGGIRFQRLRGWMFGIQQYTVLPRELASSAERALRESVWTLSGDCLAFGSMVAIPDRFVPPDAEDDIPLNKVLKNNFWNGSHLLELFDTEKSALPHLLDDAPRLQELSERVGQFWPISIAAISDRLGNVLIQVPVTVLMAQFQRAPIEGGLTVEIAWHPAASARPLRAVCESKFDGVVERFNSRAVLDAETTLRLAAVREPHCGVVWDDENDAILAATGRTSFLNRGYLTPQIADAEPRTFETNTLSGGTRRARVQLVSTLVQLAVGYENNPAGQSWTDDRLYRDEAARLARERLFKQYRPVGGDRDQPTKRHWTTCDSSSNVTPTTGHGSGIPTSTPRTCWRRCTSVAITGQIFAHWPTEALPVRVAPGWEDGAANGATITESARAQTTSWLMAVAAAFMRCLAAVRQRGRPQLTERRESLVEAHVTAQKAVLQQARCNNRGLPTLHDDREWISATRKPMR
jgi:hypothetical protein